MRKKVTEKARPVSIALRPSLAQRTMETAKKRGFSRSAFIAYLLTRELEGSDGQPLSA